MYFEFMCNREYWWVADSIIHLTTENIDLIISGLFAILELANGRILNPFGKWFWVIVPIYYLHSVTKSTNMSKCSKNNFLWDKNARNVMYNQKYDENISIVEHFFRYFGHPNTFCIRLCSEIWTKFSLTFKIFLTASIFVYKVL